jgi:DNA-binding NtrC family response regulator
VGIIEATQQQNTLHASRSSEEIKPIQARAYIKKQQILLIHQNIEQRTQISTLLKTRLHYEVKEFVSGHEALGAVQQGASPEAIVLDVSSVKDADQAIVELVALQMHIPVIVLVNYGDYQQAAESVMIGAYDFITKPFAEERLGITLRNAIALCNAKKEAESALKLANNRQSEQLYNAQHYTVDTLFSLVSSQGEIKRIQEIEKTVICFAVKFYNGRMSEVARKLGIGRSTLYRKLDAIGKI